MACEVAEIGIELYVYYLTGCGGRFLARTEEKIIDESSSYF
jgi:hypothetical protein